MSDAALFSLNDYVVYTRQTTIPTQVPHNGWFRVHPDQERLAGPFYLARCDDRWWLVHPEVISEVRIPALWRADLYEAMYEDGRTFVIPVTYPLPGKESWFDTLKEAVDLARTQWVSIESDRDQSCYLIETEPKKKRSAPDWIGGDFGDLVEFAFTDRIISTCEQARQKWPRAAKRVVLESFED